MSDNTNEHAEVGALLARCGYFSVAQYPGGWWAELAITSGYTGDAGTFQPTQLSAVRAAVEAAEKGVKS